MSSAIGPSLSTPRLLTETPNVPALGTTGASTPSSANLALSQSLSSAAFASDIYGFRSPLNGEDSAIILTQAALAIDEATKTASDNRLTNAAGGARSSIGAAISNIVQANVVLLKAETDKAKAEQEVSKKQQERAGLVLQADDLKQTLAGLNEQLQNAQESDQPALRARIAATQEVLDAKNQDMARLDTQIAPLDAQIKDLDSKIRVYQTDLRLSSLSLLATYSQVAMQSQGEDMKTVKDFADSVSLDQRFDDLTDALKSFQKNSLARTQDDAGEANKLQDEAVSNRVLQAALGLAAGVSEVVNLLKDLDRTPSVNPREAAISSGQRFQLSL